MNQLKFLMESELLTDEVKQQLIEAVQLMKTEFETKVEAEYAVKLVSEQEKLEESVTALINEAIENEVNELKDDIAKYRKLEIEYAEKLETFKEGYQAKLNEAVEAFITETIDTEVAELKTDLMEAKKEDFGKRIFEAFSDEFSEYGFGGDMKVLAADLKAAQTKLVESVETIDKMENSQKKEKLLSSLSGKKRKVMETLLEGVSTDKLEEKYNASVEFVLDKEDIDPDKEQLNESDDSDEGDRVDLNKHESVLNDAERARIRKLIG